MREACAGVQSRGRAEPGDKTMADAWYSAAGAARLAADEELTKILFMETLEKVNKRTAYLDSLRYLI